MKLDRVTITGADDSESVLAQCEELVLDGKRDDVPSIR